MRIPHTVVRGFSSSRYLLVLIAACDGTVGNDTATGPDAGTITADAPTQSVDASAACVSRTDGTDTDRGRLGGAGGSKAPMLTCSDAFGERVVGIAVQMSNQNTIFGGRSAQGIRIACAQVQFGPTGTVEVGAVTTHDISGDGGYSWSPSTWTAVTQCQPGWVVSGLLVHTGTTSNLFDDVTITCSELMRAGGTARTETKKVVGSLVDSAGPTTAKCPTGSVATGFGPFLGAGLDAVELYCATASCH